MNEYLEKMEPVKIKLNPLDKFTADEIMLNYADNKGYKINYITKKTNKPFGNKTRYYFFIINNVKYYAGCFKNNKLEYKAL
tara:strand:+ start:109 stop:351 length:243 start_codon:yes stop_codon:yes gene_type:complete